MALEDTPTLLPKAVLCSLAATQEASSDTNIAPEYAKSKCQPERRGSKERTLSGAPLGGAVAQRLRGFKSAEPEKTVKRSSRRTGVNLQFFPVQPSALGLKGASSPFFVAPARRNRWHFSGSLLVSKENIPRQQPLPPRSAVQTKKREPSEKTEDSRLFTIFSYSPHPFRQG